MKIKSKINILFGGLIVMSLLSSCNNDPYDFPPNTEKPVVTYTGTEREFTLTEEDPEILLSFTTNRAITEPMHFKFILDTAKATAGIMDLSIGDGPIGYSYGDAAQMYIAEIPAFTKDFTIPVSAISDFDLEETETMRVRIDEVKSRNAIIKGDHYFTFNIKQIVSDNLISRLLWSGTYVGIDGETYNIADEYSLTLAITDAAFTTILLSGTLISIEPGDLPDGNYLLAVNYASAPASGSDAFPDTAAEGTPESIPLRLQVVKKGGFNKTIDLSDMFTDLTTGNANYYSIATLNIQGTTYTITNDQGEVVAQGLTNEMTAPISSKK